MKCENCSAPATVHLTTIENKQKKVQHYCQECAEKKDFVQEKELNLPMILQTVLGQHVDAETDALSRLACPHCGIKYMELRAEGRLGCPYDYEIFRAGLYPLLKRIHRSTVHRGKIPASHPRPLVDLKEIADLRRQLEHAITSEAYEEAAQVRDLLREKEAAYETG